MSRHSADDILRAFAVAARLVELHGDDFVPFFEVVEGAVAKLQSKQAAAVRARDISARLRDANQPRELGYGLGYAPVERT